MTTQKNESVKNGVIFPVGDENPYSQYFMGKSYLQMLVADPDVDVNVGNVTFEPGTRNNWHIHHGFQILLVTGGEGWYQEEGHEPQLLKPGDVVVSKNHKRHWHGATKDSWFEHIAITSGASDFFEPLSDEEYNKLGE